MLQHNSTSQRAAESVMLKHNLRPPRPLKGARSCTLEAINPVPSVQLRRSGYNAP